MEFDLQLNGLTAALVALAAGLIAVLPRRTTMIPILVAFCFLPADQYVKIVGLHFYLFRLVLLVSLVRVLARGELTSVRWCRLDTIVLLWMTAFMGLGTISHPGWASFIMQTGTTFDWLTSYIVCRALVRDRSDLLRQARFLAIMMIPLAAAMTVERVTERNVFSVLGDSVAFPGDDDEIEVMFRDGKVRARAAFSHPILAGTFGATMLPLMMGLVRFRNRGLRWSGVAGAFSAALVIWGANSSGPMLAAFGSIAALFIWNLRHSLRLVRVGLVLILLMLQAGMSRPIWWIFDSVSALSGGTGWHRSYIIDAAISHWDEWWLVGTPRTVHWGGFHAPPRDPNNVDITNEYIVQAVNGGILTLFLFLAMIWICFNRIGYAFSAKRGSITRQTEWLAWCTGVALLSHCISFLSVAYYDKTIFYFFWLLSAIAAGAIERSWLTCDQPAPSGRGLAKQQAILRAGADGVGLSGAIRAMPHAQSIVGLRPRRPQPFRR